MMTSSSIKFKIYGVVRFPSMENNLKYNYMTTYIMLYYCDTCGYHACQKSNYDRHMMTKKHIERERNKSNQERFDSSYGSLALCNPTACKYCHKQFTTTKSMKRHIKYSCKKNEDEDLKELVRLLNEKQNREKDKKITTLENQINKLAKKLQIQSISTQNNNIGIINHNHNYNVKLLNFVDTDYSHLTTKDYAKCVTDCNHCVKTLIEKVHFNTKKPENMNVYIASMKDKYIMMYKDNEWTLQNRKKIIDRMYSDN